MTNYEWVDPRDAFLALTLGEGGKCGWAVVTSVHGDREVENVRSGLAESKSEAVDEALTPILQDSATPVNLLTISGEWDELVPQLQSWTHVEPKTRSEAHVHLHRGLAFAEAGQRLATGEKEVTVVATDGSFSANQLSAGWAWISSDGEFDAGAGRGVSSTAAEMQAIVAALKRHRGDVKILVDCAEALRLCQQGPAATRNGHLNEMARKVLSLTRGREVSFEWVRAHDGHALNEGANRLAISVRRSYESRVDREIVRSVNTAIAEECVSAHSAGDRVTPTTRPVGV